MSQEEIKLNTEKLPEERIRFIYKAISDELKTKNKSAIARFFGMSSQAVGQWEAGENPPALHKLYNFSLRFNLSLHWLLTGKGPKYKSVVESIKDGQVDVEKVKLEALQSHHLDEVSRLLEEIKRRQEPSDTDSSKVVPE